MEKRPALYGTVAFLLLLAITFAFLYAVLHSLKQTGRSSWGDGDGPEIGVVNISGVIEDSEKTIAELHEYRKNSKIKAVVVRINSPGGAVAPSQEIYRAILRTRKVKKVICSMGTVAASGGYYIAAACDRILASAGTITGSIGVVTEMPHVHELLKILHVQVDTITSGAMKDIGSPLRPMTESERAFFQQFVTGIYDQFLTDVAEARHLEKEKLREIADGRIFTGKEAVTLKLIDEIGNFEDALERAVDLQGLKGEPVPVFPKEDGAGWLADVFSSVERRLTPKGSIQLRDPRL